MPLGVVRGATCGPTIAATVLVGRLEEAAAAPSAPRRFRLREATLGARVPLPGLLAALHSAPAPATVADGGRYCEAPIALQAAATELCKRADTAGSAALDLLPGTTCDALGWGPPCGGYRAAVHPRGRPARGGGPRGGGGPPPRLDLLCP